MNFLLINSGDSDPLVAFGRSGNISVSRTSDFTEVSPPGSKKPDKLIHCLSKIAGENDLNTIEAISVTIGPGSFTGIRVGISIAKGLAFGIDRKIIPINNFNLCLNRLGEISPEKKYFVLIPAKLPEYYWAVIKNNVTLDSGCTIPENLAGIIEKDTLVVGDFDDESLIKHYYFKYINVKNLKNELDSMLELTQKGYDSGQAAEEIEPLYIKNFNTRKITKREY